jgi:tripartite-type tricarboxylate transporter receptor subunit TctC
MMFGLHTRAPIAQPPARRAAAALASAVALAAALSAPASFAAYPDKPVKLIVGSPPSSPSDITARLLGERLAERWKQVVTVENRPGAGNSLAAQQVAQAPADGLTLLIVPDTVVTVNPLIYKQLKFDPLAALTPVVTVASWPQVLACNANAKIDSVAQLLQAAKARKVTYSSGGAGTPGHLTGEMFSTAAGIDLDHVPYKGPAPALTDLLGGQVDCSFIAIATLLPHANSGKLKILATSGAKPSPWLPGVPTFSQALNKPGTDASFSLLLMVPKATPAATVTDLETAVVDTLNRPEVQERLRAAALEARGVKATETLATLKAEMPKWTAIVKRLNLSLD